MPNPVPERFGIEIEGFAGPGGTNAILRALRSEGVAVKDQRRTHLGYDRSKWVLKRDGSLDEDPDGREGFELVSPPLDFNNPEDRASVDQVVEILRNVGCQADELAGIHVHVNAIDLDPKQLAAIVRFVYKFEDALYRIASSGWLTIRPGAHSFARPIPSGLAMSAMKVREHDALTKMWNEFDWAESARYSIVNLDNWWMRGTVEFRCFNSSLSPIRIQAYIALSVAIVRDARNGRSRSIAKRYPLGWMADRNKYEAQGLLIRLQQVLTTRTGDGKKSKSNDTQPPMNREDWKKVLFCWRDSVPQKNKEQHSYV